MKRTAHGLTLIELLVVVAVLGIIATVAAPSFRDFISMQRLKSINAQLVTDMQFARTEAAARNAIVRVRFEKDSAQTCYVLFTGAWNGCTCLSSPTCSAGNVEIRSVRVPTDLNVTVAPPTGAVSSFEIVPTTGAMITGTDDGGAPLADPFVVETRIDTSRNLRVVINRSGRPSVCKPTGSTMAVPACP